MDARSRRGAAAARAGNRLRRGSRGPWPQRTRGPAQVNASGIVLDVRDRLPLQIFSVSDGRVANEVQLEFLRQGLTIRVSGSFSRGANGRRADVSFDNFELFGGDGRRTAEARWLFALVNRFRPALATGDEATSWLETTYLSPTLRVGRGNKGSVFILQKDDEPSRLDPATF